MFWASTAGRPFRPPPPAGCTLPRLRGGREPPLLVHQVQRQHALERDPGGLGDPAHLVEQVRRLALDGGDEARRPHELGDERRRVRFEPGRDVGVPALEQRLIYARSASPWARPRSRAPPRHSTIASGVTATIQS